MLQTSPNGNGKEIDLKHIIEDTHPSRKGIICSYTLFVIYQEQPLVFVVIHVLCKIFTLLVFNIYSIYHYQGNEGWQYQYNVLLIILSLNF